MPLNLFKRPAGKRSPSTDSLVRIQSRIQLVSWLLLVSAACLAAYWWMIH